MENYINQILEKNNRVIVPDFGAFIVKQRKPLTIVFNEFLQYNDGMLVDIISKNEDLDREKAKDKVDAFVKSVLSKLDKGQKYPLEGLGILIKSSTGKISLEGDEVKTTSKPKPAAKAIKKEEKPKAEEAKAEKAKEVEAKAEKEKLEKEKAEKAKAEEAKKAQSEKAKLEEDKKAQAAKLKLEKEKKDQAEKERLEREKAAQAKIKAEQTERNKSPQASKEYSYKSTATKPANSKKKTSKQNILLWVIVIVLINAIIVTAYFMFSFNLPSLFGKPDSEEMLIEEPSIEEDNYVTESYEEAAESTPVNEVIPEENIIPESTPSKKQISQGTRYYVVAGAFGNENNADNLVIDLKQKGYNSEKFGKIGILHAVSYDVFNSKSDANQMLRKIQAETDPQAWIKRVD